MKNYKYRAWDIKKNEMVYDALKLSGTNQLVSVNAEYFNSPFSFFDGCIWMIFTEYLDDNAQEIYEGDLIKIKNDKDPSGYSIEEVVFDWRGLGVIVGDMHIRIDMLSEVNLVGNIYQTIKEKL